MASTSAAEEGLWRYLCSIDLTEKLEGWNCDPNALLPLLVADPRRIKQTLTDGMWVRILDVAAALTARRYRSEGRLVLEVDDPYRGSAAGVFLLDVEPDGVTCEPTSERADVRLDIRELSSAYLGEVRFRDLWRVGLIGGSEEAVDRAEMLFSWPVRPWCPEVF
jgi:predicted acetyltransferase